MALVISVLLALIALAGLGWNFVSGAIEIAGGRPETTVDGLFSSLIFATMFAIFAINALHELRGLRTRRKQLKAQPATATAATAAGGGASASAPAAGRAAAEVCLERARPVVALGVRPAVRTQGPAETVAGLGVRSVLVRDGALLPAGVTAKPSDWSGWRVIDTDATGLQRAAKRARLEVFYFVGPVIATAFAVGRGNALRKALARAAEAANLRGRNALEITGLRARSFFGLCYAEATVQVRHIQASPFGFEAQPAAEREAPAPSTGIMPASPEQELSTAA